MRFAVAGQFALDAAKAFQILERHAVETIIAAQGVNPVFGVPGVVDEVIRLIPLAALSGKHDAMNRRHDFGESGGPPQWQAAPPLTA